MDWPGIDCFGYYAITHSILCRCLSSWAFFGRYDTSLLFNLHIGLVLLYSLLVWVSRQILSHQRKHRGRKIIITYGVGFPLRNLLNVRYHNTTHHRSYHFSSRRNYLPVLHLLLLQRSSKKSYKISKTKWRKSRNDGWWNSRAVEIQLREHKKKT